ncbi:MAG: extracellular solute-binding protein [Actinomycetota bacterium]|nr:extracellular solute-binding protein [Actinomycetota bacterium]
MVSRRLIVGAALGSLLLSACISGTGGSSSDGGSEEGGPTVIRYFVGIEETPELEAEAKTIIEDFEAENPDIDVERESISAEDQRTVIQTRLRSPQPPDVFGFDTGPGFAGVLAKADLLYPLEDAYKEHDWPVYDWAKARVTYDGVLSGVPGSVEEIGVFYNQDLFSELGFEEPQTIEELDQIAQAVKTEGLIPFAFGDQEQWPAGHLFSIAASNVLGPEGLDQALYGSAKWNSPEVVEGIDLMFSEFVEKGYYPEDVNAITYEDANNLFYAGKAAMAPTGTWLVPEIDSTVQDFKVGFFPFPAIDDTGIAPPSGVGGGLFVAADTEEPEAALKLIDYLQFNEQRVKEDLERANTIPAFKVDTSDLDLTPLFRSVLDDLAEAENPDSFGYNIDVLAPAGFNDVMFKGFQSVLAGERTAQEQADALQDAYAEAKANGETLEKP